MTTRLFVLFLVLAAANTIAAEAPSVSGTVRDPQDRPVPGAVVTLHSRASRSIATTTSDTQGAYRFPGVLAGGYFLRAEAPGFAAFLFEDLRVDAPVIREIGRAHV